ncbi:helix-turn-helix domain-containing protein [Kineococcus sp. SYSU DK003]|uniref:helix-turn-helix domain-containing protein n=1 Tax=Kineococcus sp. SYSU DK003 TaxID=3383124 RepID=UPI003D7EDA19
MYRERACRIAGARVWENRPPAPGGGPVLPDGCMDLLWSRTGRELLVAGPDTRPHHGEHSPGGWSGLRFAPGQAPALLGVPAHELRDARVPLADLWDGALVRRLAEQVEAADASGRAGAALEALAASVPARDDALVRAARWLAAGRTVTDVADDLGLGVRTLHRRSLAAFGYAPQVLGRVLRFRRAVRALRTGRAPAQVAVAAGYADQAHLTREVRTFAGVTPRALQLRVAKRSTDPPSGSSTVA